MLEIDDPHYLLKSNIRYYKRKLRILILSKISDDSELPVMEQIITEISQLESQYNLFWDSLHYLSSSTDEINLNNLNVTRNTFKRLEELSIILNKSILENSKRINQIVDECSIEAEPIVKKIQLLEAELAKKQKDEN